MKKSIVTVLIIIVSSVTLVLGGFLVGSPFTSASVTQITTPWTQPIWDGNTSEHGTVTSSGELDTRPGWGAFDGWVGTVGNGESAGFTATQWTKDGTTGWLQLELNYDIKVNSIEFVNRSATNNNWTRHAHFVGTNGIALGAPFEAPFQNRGVVNIPVGGVVTNIIRLEVTSSWNNLVGAMAININAERVSDVVDWPLFGFFGDLSESAVERLLNTLSEDHTEVRDRDTQFMLFPNIGTGNTLELSRLMWRVVTVDGDRVTLWATGAYRTSQFHNNTTSGTGGHNMPLYRDSLVRTNLLHDFNHLLNSSMIDSEIILPYGSDHDGANPSDIIWLPSENHAVVLNGDNWNWWGLSTAQSRPFHSHGSGNWNSWLRTSANNQVDSAVVINQSFNRDWRAGTTSHGIRPALHLSLSALQNAADWQPPEPEELPLPDVYYTFQISAFYHGVRINWPYWTNQGNHQIMGTVTFLSGITFTHELMPNISTFNLPPHFYFDSWGIMEGWIIGEEFTPDDVIIAMALNRGHSVTFRSEHNAIISVVEMVTRWDGTETHRNNQLNQNDVPIIHSTELIRFDGWRRESDGQVFPMSMPIHVTWFMAQIFHQSETFTAITTHARTFTFLDYDGSILSVLHGFYTIVNSRVPTSSAIAGHWFTHWNLKGTNHNFISGCNVYAPIDAPQYLTFIPIYQRAPVVTFFDWYGNVIAELLAYYFFIDLSQVPDVPLRDGATSGFWFNQDDLTLYGRFTADAEFGAIMDFTQDPNIPEPEYDDQGDPDPDNDNEESAPWYIWLAVGGAVLIGVVIKLMLLGAFINVLKGNGRNRRRR